MSAVRKSETIVIQSPMSFVGSFYRAKRLVDGHEGFDRTVRYVLLGLILLVWWAAVIVWYSIFGLLLVPYRLIRRGARKRNVERLRHQEMLAEMSAIRAPAAPPPGTEIEPL